MLKFNVGSTETSGKIIDVRDVIFFINFRISWKFNSLTLFVQVLEKKLPSVEESKRSTDWLAMELLKQEPQWKTLPIDLPIETVYNLSISCLFFYAIIEKFQKKSNQFLKSLKKVLLVCFCPGWEFFLLYFIDAID